MTKLKKINKLVNMSGLISEERRVNFKYSWKHKIKPSIVSYSYKIFSASVFSFFYLMFLYLIGFKISWLNYLAAVSIYFIIEDYKGFLFNISKVYKK